MNFPPDFLVVISKRNGLGWFTDTLNNNPRVSHDGKIPGFKSNINRFLLGDICIIALSNANNSAVGGMVRNIANIIYHQSFAKTIPDQQTIEMPDSIKAVYTGIYKFGEAEDARVSVELMGSDLTLSVPGNEKMKLEPLNKNIFAPAWPGSNFPAPLKKNLNLLWFIIKVKSLAFNK